MVPRQFQALLRRHYDHQLRSEFGAAIICRTIHAFAGKKTELETFMPSWKREKKPEADWQTLLAKTKVLHAEFGGAS